MKAFSFDKLKKTAAGVLAAVIIFAVLSPLAPHARALDDPAVDAEAAILVDIDAGSVLYSLNESVRRAPASLVKIMTALLPTSPTSTPTAPPNISATRPSPLRTCFTPPSSPRQTSPATPSPAPCPGMYPPSSP